MSSTHRRAREQAAVREKILAAARVLFLRQGFEAVTMRAIAGAIEYTAPALYTHFRDKRDLLLALCREDFALFRRALGNPGNSRDPVERLRRMGRAYVRFALSHPHHYRLMFMTRWPALPHEPAPEHRDPDADAYAFLRLAVAEAIRANALRPSFRDVDAVTQLLWGAAHGVVSLHLTHGDDPCFPWRPVRATAYALLDASLDGLLRSPKRGSA